MFKKTALLVRDGFPNLLVSARPNKRIKKEANNFEKKLPKIVTLIHKININCLNIITHASTVIGDAVGPVEDHRAKCICICVFGVFVFLYLHTWCTYIFGEFVFLCLCICIFWRWSLDP